MILRRAGCLLALLGASGHADAGEPGRFPLPVDLAQSEGARLAAKEPLAQRTIDDMEGASAWTARGAAQLEHVSKPVREGKRSLALHFPIRVEPREPRKDGEGGLGEAQANLAIDGADWSGYNRISYWLYVKAPGHPYIQVRTTLFNGGKPANPHPQISPAHFTNLRPGVWNHVVWEIPDLDRGQVTGLQIAHEIRGKPVAAASDQVTFVIDDLIIEKVDADYNRGWAVAPGRIAYNHTGYTPSGSKVALASDLDAGTFTITDARSKRLVHRGPVETRSTPAGSFQVMDFSELRAPGLYVLTAGRRSTGPFRIAEDPWSRPLWKTLSFFHAMRCGTEVPGVHDICHQDFFSEHEGKRLVAGGGWHDAADLSQNKWNTAEAVYAMYRLAEALETNGKQGPLLDRLLEEAQWGLDWLVKTDFRNGWRHVSSAHRFWSNNIPGDNDDVIVTARWNPNTAFLTAQAEAAAARVLARRNHRKSAESLALAELTFSSALSQIAERPTYRWDTQTLSAAVTAAAELAAATGREEYRVRATGLARMLLDHQERSVRPEFTEPLAGYFYADASKRRLAESGHFGIEHKPLVALTRLCELFPGHPDWVLWYAAAAIHSDHYLEPTAEFTAPYRHPVNSLWNANAPAPADRRRTGAWEPAEALRIGEGWYVRPFQPGGDNATSLASVKALSAAAALRRRADLHELAVQQMAWFAGFNPFGKSLMTGEGYDWSTQYSYTGDILGALSVGIQSLDGRLPYWQVTNKWIYREIWMHPVYLWMWVLEDLQRAPAPARLKLSSKTSGDAVEITAESGSAPYEAIALRTYNLKVSDNVRSAGKTAVWKAVVEDVSKPWVAVAIPDGDVNSRVDLTGWSQR